MQFKLPSEKKPGWQSQKNSIKRPVMQLVHWPVSLAQVTQLEAQVLHNATPLTAYFPEGQSQVLFILPDMHVRQLDAEPEHVAHCTAQAKQF